MSDNEHARVIVLGAGPAGYTAAIYAARAMLEPLLITGIQPGGQLTITTDVENYPGFALPVQGPWLVEQMQEQAVHMGTRIAYDMITSVELGMDIHRLHGESGKIYSCNALIVATGAKAKWLGMPSEEFYKGFGVSACATCDGPFFRGKTVVVVGGGNTAVEEALYLTNFADRVILVHRRDHLRAEQILQQRLLGHPKIELRFNTIVAEISGTDKPRQVTGAVLQDVTTQKTEHIDADGVFVSIGHAPATELFAGQLPLKSGGYLTTEANSSRTIVPGVFAAGDVADDVYRQAVTAAGMGCMAALDAERYLTKIGLSQAA